MNENISSLPSHFGNKEALEHVIEKRAEGVMAFSEAHGTEIPGHLSAAADTARETTLALLLIWMGISLFELPFRGSLVILLCFGIAWGIWKTGRSAWLAWSRLERLHRVIEQEKFEIEHHREQERSELAVLYKAKGFEGKLLEDVLDVLMADGDRLLKVMLEEELGLTLGAHEHPLKQALGAFIGWLSSALIFLSLFLFFSSSNMVFVSLGTIGFAAALSAKYEKNRIIAAIVWNLSLAVLCLGFIYFISRLLLELL